MQIEFLQVSLVSMASSQPPDMQVPISPPLQPSYCVLQWKNELQPHLLLIAQFQS